MELSVGIDAFRLVTAPRTSHAIYISELAKALSALEEIKRLYLFIPRLPVNDSNFDELARLEKVEFMRPEDACYPERGFRGQIYWIHFVIPRLVRKHTGSMDYYVAPYHHPPIFLASKIRVITVIHDLCGLSSRAGYTITKKGFYRHLFMFVVAGIKSATLVPISNHTRKQFVAFFPYFARRLSGVVYNCVSGGTIETLPAQKTLSKFGLSDTEYFLAFGLPGVRKGLDLISDAFNRYKSRGGRAKLALIVPKRYRAAVREHFCDASIIKDTVMLSDVDTSERDALYSGALALLFPSRCEGFGYPIVEAMRQGCPPIAWEQSPALELVDHHVRLLSRLEPEEIVKQMNHYEALDCEARRKLSSRLIERSLVFERQDFGREFLDAMNGSI